MRIVESRIALSANRKNPIVAVPSLAACKLCSGECRSGVVLTGNYV
jgi:hypothetical protein